MSDEATSSPPQLPSRLRPSAVARTGTAHSIADCGLRIADCGLRIADCGLRIADCGLIVDCRVIVDCCRLTSQSPIDQSTINPQSAILNPQWLARNISAARAHAVVAVAQFDADRMPAAVFLSR